MNSYLLIFLITKDTGANCNPINAFYTIVAPVVATCVCLNVLLFSILRIFMENWLLREQHNFK